jgi:hypothetical protein
MIKIRNFFTRLFSIIILVMCFQFIDTKSYAADAGTYDPTCTLVGGVWDVSAHTGSASLDGATCVTQPEILQFTVKRLAVCTAAPTAPTNVLFDGADAAVDLTNCRILFNGTATAILSAVGQTVEINSGEVLNPGSGVFTHVFIEALPVIGIQASVNIGLTSLYANGYDARTSYTGSNDDSALDASTTAGYCYTVTGSHINSVRNNAACGATAAGGLSLITMYCMDSACETDSGTTYVTDWRTAMTVDGSAITFYYVNSTTGVLCNTANCYGTPGLVQGIQTLATPVGSDTAVPTSFNINFRISTAVVVDQEGGIDNDATGGNKIAFRPGPIALTFDINY